MNSTTGVVRFPATTLVLPPTRPASPLQSSRRLSAATVRPTGRSIIGHAMSLGQAGKMSSAAAAAAVAAATTTSTLSLSATRGLVKKCKPLLCTPLVGGDPWCRFVPNVREETKENMASQAAEIKELHAKIEQLAEQVALLQKNLAVLAKCSVEEPDVQLAHSHALPSQVVEVCVDDKEVTASERDEEAMKVVRAEGDEPKTERADGEEDLEPSAMETLAVQFAYERERRRQCRAALGLLEVAE